MDLTRFTPERTRRPRRTLRKVRPRAHRRQLLPQPALPQVPGRGGQRVAGGTPSRAVAGALLPRRVHRTALAHRADSTRLPSASASTSCRGNRATGADQATIPGATFPIAGGNAERRRPAVFFPVLFGRPPIERVAPSDSGRRPRNDYRFRTFAANRATPRLGT